MSVVLNKRKNNLAIQWYKEEAGFFGPGYLKEYKDFLTPDRTKTEIDFLLKVLKLKKGRKILDLCCGHGRHTIELALRGYEMTAQDINSFFLKEARKSAKAAGVDIRWIKSDMRTIPFKEEFDAVFNLFTAFGYLENDDEDEKAIKQVASALKPGGIFVLDTISREWIIRSYKEREWRKLNDGSIIIEERRFDFIKGKNYEERTIVKNGKIERKTPIIIRLYTLTELVEMCENYGLKLKETYGGYNGEKLSLDSKRYILVAKKA